MERTPAPEWGDGRRRPCGVHVSLPVSRVLPRPLPCTAQVVSIVCGRLGGCWPLGVWPVQPRGGASPVLHFIHTRVNNRVWPGGGHSGWPAPAPPVVAAPLSILNQTPASSRSLSALGLPASVLPRVVPALPSGQALPPPLPWPLDPGETPSGVGLCTHTALRPDSWAPGRQGSRSGGSRGTACVTRPEPGGSALLPVRSGTRGSQGTCELKIT